MQVIQGEQNLGAIEFGDSLVKASDSWEVEKQLSTRAEFQHKVKLRLCLECELKLYNEWMNNVFLCEQELRIW